MPNNIIITPGSASIQFSGSANNDTIRLQVEPSGSVAFYGNSGSLFSIVDQLSGSLMSVNDISGLPILEVFSDNRVVAGTFNQNTLVVTGSRIGIRKASPNAELDVSGSVFVSGGIEIISGSDGLTVRMVPGSYALIGGTTGNTVVQSANIPRVIFSGNGILPFLNNFYNLGDTSLRWNNAFINNIFSSGSNTHTGSISVLSGSITSSGPQNGISISGGTGGTVLTIRDDLNGSIIYNATSALPRFRLNNANGFYHDGVALSPETNGNLSLGQVGFRWRNLFTTGSISHTGSISTLSGSITSSGPQNGIAISAAGGTILTLRDDGIGNSIINSVGGQLRLRVAGDGVAYNGEHLYPETTNGKRLGLDTNRWQSAHINNIVSSGSITNTGSLSILSGSINITNGGITGSLLGTSSLALTALTASYFDGFITFPSGLDITGSLIVTGSQTTIGNQIISGAITSSGTGHGLLLTSGAVSYSTTFGSGGYIINSNNSFQRFRVNNSATGFYFDGGLLAPESNGGLDLGSITTRWRNIFTTGSINHTGSLNIFSGSISASNGDSGLSITLGGGSVIYRSLPTTGGVPFLRFRTGTGNGIFFNGQTWAPEQNGLLSLGISDFRWGNLFTTGSINHSGSIVAASGSITSTGPQSALTLDAGPGQLVLFYENGNYIYRAITATHVFRVNSTNTLSIDTNGFGPISNNIYGLGGPVNRFSTGHINSLISSGSITNTGSLVITGSTQITGAFGISQGTDTLTISSVGGATSLLNSSGQLRIQNYVFAGSAYFAPPVDGARTLGLSNGRWSTGFINNIVSSGSITNTGSLLIVSGAVTSSGPQNEFTTLNGAGTITGYMKSVDGVGVEIGSRDQSVLLRASNQTVAQVSTVGFISPADLGTNLGTATNRWRSLAVGSVTASIVSASSGITGSLFGSSSFATTASFAVSASWAPSVGGPGGGLTTKAGSIANTSFTGNPRKAAVNFSTAFANTNYAIVITGEDARSWTVEGKVVGGFTASANSNTNLAGTTYWIATAYGET